MMLDNGGDAGAVVCVGDGGGVGEGWWMCGVWWWRVGGESTI